MPLKPTAVVLQVLTNLTLVSSHEAATNQLKRLAAEMTAQCLNDIRSLDDWKKQQPELRRQLLDMLGLDPLPKRTPLKAQITGRLERDAYRIEKIVFQSLPGLYVTGNFYVPKGAAKGLPTILDNGEGLFPVMYPMRATRDGGSAMAHPLKARAAMPMANETVRYRSDGNCMMAPCDS